MRPDAVTYVGHSSVLIELGGLRVLTDPVLRSRIAYIQRIAPLPPAEVYTGLDAVLISHAHHDHLDLLSLRRVPHDVPVIAPPGCAGAVRRSGHAVVEAVVGERVRAGGVEVLAIPAEHDGRRFPIGPRRPAIGYVMGRVGFYGDTDVFDGMADLAGELDVALLPVWGWGPKVGPGHLDPERAARAAALLAPRIAVPIHWGTLARAGVWWRADPEMPAREFAERTAVHAPAVSVRVLQPGERLSL